MTRPIFALGVLLLVVLVGAPPPDSTAEDPVAELTRALQGLGAPGLLWGRLAVEEESPDGPMTPLVGVEVVFYPYTPSLAADLERIRDRARESGAEYDNAVAHLQERLKAFEAQVAALGPRDAGKAPGQTTPPGQATPAGQAAPAGAGADRGPIRRRTTDAAGTFVVEDLPAGEWLLVAIQVSAYTAPKDQPKSRTTKKGGSGTGTFSGFLTRPSTPAKQAEVWVTRARVSPGDRARTLLTDRTRFMVGPVR